MTITHSLTRCEDLPKHSKYRSDRRVQLAVATLLAEILNYCVRIQLLSFQKGARRILSTALTRARRKLEKIHWRIKAHADFLDKMCSTSKPPLVAVSSTSTDAERLKAWLDPQRECHYTLPLFIGQLRSNLGRVFQVGKRCDKLSHRSFHVLTSLFKRSRREKPRPPRSSDNRNPWKMLYQLQA